jgi:hypothetical protein
MNRMLKPVRTLGTLLLAMCLLTPALPQEQPLEYPVECKLPPDAVITYPDSNPLRDALNRVPWTAIFKLEGWSLWDPSLIKVGDTYHLFCSRWPKQDAHSFDSVLCLA